MSRVYTREKEITDVTPVENHFLQHGTRHLKIHINSVHNGQKDHKCVSCGKSFSESGSLKTHINAVHNGQRDHKCDSCGKSFAQSVVLRRHIFSVHNGQKDYKCDLIERL